MRLIHPVGEKWGHFFFFGVCAPVWTGAKMHIVGTAQPKWALTEKRRDGFSWHVVLTEP